MNTSNPSAGKLGRHFRAVSQATSKPVASAVTEEPYAQSSTTRAQRERLRRSCAAVPGLQGSALVTGAD